MSFLDGMSLEDLKGKLITDKAALKKIYRAKKSEFQFKSVDHSLVSDYVQQGWEEYTTPLKTKTKLRKRKTHDRQFEDDVWCQLYDLGYTCLSYDRTFALPYGKDPADTKQIDIVAANEESVLLVECKSSIKSKRPKSYKEEFDALVRRMGGFRKSLDEIFHRGVRFKFIFATRNLRVDSQSEDIKRLVKNNVFHYNDNTYAYVDSLLKKYKNAAFYQWNGLLFRGDSISRSPIEVPAVEGKMGNRVYYMFSLEPNLLLRMGFILHRTEANESEMPTYQRLLVPSRLKGITKFIDGGGYFPNSIIINFNQRRSKLKFEADSRGEDTRSRVGYLKIPNAYAIAYIIDGQHRLYGYANSLRKESNTIPVVAFKDLDPSEQLKIFMDINENQKSVSATLRLTLEEDLYWSADRADSRIKALRSSIVRCLSTEQGPLYRRIQIGEDAALLSSKPFSDALRKSDLLPHAKGNKFQMPASKCGLYDTANHENDHEMRRCRASAVAFINKCYELVEDRYPMIFEREKYLILSNRGSFAFISLIGSVNRFLSERGEVSPLSSPDARFKALETYLTALCDGITKMSEEDENRLLQMRGSEVETKWLREFQNLVHIKFADYCPEELKDWLERQDDALQDEGRRLGTDIESLIKREVISKLKNLYGDNWDLEIGEIKSQCEQRASDEIQRNYKEGLGRKEIPWTDMFFIKDYKTIIEKHWNKRPEGAENFSTMEEVFAIDAGIGKFNSKGEKLKWMSVFNSHRNLWAHQGTREKRLNREEVTFLRNVHSVLVSRLE
ncbi:hypothetical protein GCM10027285_20720 [Oleiagrimonas citrea]|uniref:DGQHR domain-containing protein n=1 Tax=Oleiagrimonas citrea TaxID=1665687 RepID=A0A846ZJ44_9GAMM|nr:DGQHR domain-containing protein [Oleiagrimonas citrea]NKZ37613.1 DGQHR domain-containing protein [Oleiagrimonas citrea]